jgi:hypothetical protein
MTGFRPRFLSFFLTAGFLAATAHAGTLSGTVINRTTGKPTANVDLSLISPTQGMRDLGSAKSDAQGHFTFTNDAIGMAPTLVRATFHDVSFNTFAPPGRPNVDVEIYDISKDPKTITVASHVIIYEPQGDKLVGAEEYTVDNNAQPPAAYFRTEGNFDFAIPENATIGQVTTASGAMGMSVNQASIEKGKGRFAIAFPFRPGQTNVRLSYQLAYTNNAATLKIPATYANMRMLIVAPPGITVTADGLQPSGQEQGMMVYTHAPLAPKSTLSISLSGVPVPQSADAGGDQGQPQGQGAMPQEGNSRTQGAEIQSVPGRLDDFKWYLLGGLAALFAMGAILLTRKQVIVAPATEPDVESVAASAPPRAKSSAAQSAPAKTPTSPAPPAASVAAVNQQVTSSLDSLKDSIFRLELRRQAGTISEEDYARERAQMEKLLRDLVRG